MARDILKPTAAKVIIAKKLCNKDIKMPELEDAILLAAQMHKGQTDKAGQPYILHPLRVMMKVDGDREKTVAALHDLIEDTTVTLEDLKQKGYSKTIVDAVDCLTKRQGEKYDDYIERVAVNELAVKVKLADLRDNMELRTANNLAEKQNKKMHKYQKAFDRLSPLVK